MWHRIKVIKKIALPIVLVKVRAADGHTWLESYTLLDGGSTNSFCNTSVTSQLKLARKSVNLELTTLLGTKKDTLATVVQLVVSDIDGQHQVLYL